MRAKHLVLSVVVTATLGIGALATTAWAEDSIYIPLFTYRTGPFAGSGIPIANGMHDYFTMLN